MKRRMLWVGFLAVCVPLGILLGLQYRWLVSLQHTSAIAEKAWLNNYLVAVGSEVEYFYRKQAERSLNIPTNVFAGAPPEKVAHYFKKKDVKGAKYLFAAKFPGGKMQWLYGYDPVAGKFGKPMDPDAYRAITVALSPWKTLAMKDGDVSSDHLVVEEKDPENRIILMPIIDESAGFLGVAGMVVDGAYFKEVVLPAAIGKMFSKFFDKRAKENLIIEVRDGESRLVQGTEIELKETKQVKHRIQFIFSDWQMILGSRHVTPEEWAKSNFLLNISLSVVLAVVILSGVVLALRTASREMRLSAMKSDFVSNVSHELRTPLASIRVFGEFLRLGRVREDPKIREYGVYIETESRRLTQLINNILDFSKIESGAKTYDFRSADIIELVSDTLRTLELSLKHKGFRLDLHTPAEPIPPVDVDVDALAQALANLVDNAVKYSDGGKEISVSVQRNKSDVVIAVKDQGIGISPDEQHKIFERFHRVSTGLIHDVKGSGLGLSIVNHIVKAHGGSVVVESELGRGSTFFIRLPLSSRSALQATELIGSQGSSVEQMGKS
jgi:signal transduction histidine kinase